MGNWIRVRKTDSKAVKLANRHYSRIAFGKQGRMLGPPGRLLCFRTRDGDANWVSHWPYEEFAMDNEDSFRCTMFRNEGDVLSSELIIEAMELTEDIWLNKYDTLPCDEWVTWIAPELIRSSNPGFCFKQAGWYTDHSWKCARTDVKLIKMRSTLLADFDSMPNSMDYPCMRCNTPVGMFNPVCKLCQRRKKHPIWRHNGRWSDFGRNFWG